MTMTERQEVARRLRALDCKIRLTDTLESACNNLMQATYGIDHQFSPIEFSVRNLCGLASVLADLIDPTCHDFGGEEGTNGEGYDFACSICGWCGDVTEPNYCPYCGARVVIEDE